MKMGAEAGVLKPREAKDCRQHQRLGWNRFFTHSFREHGPADALVSDF